MELVIPSDGVVCDGHGRAAIIIAGAPQLSERAPQTPMVPVADMLGDGRDRLVRFNSREIVVYTDPDSPIGPFDPKPVVMERCYNATDY